MSREDFEDFDFMEGVREDVRMWLQTMSDALMDGNAAVVEPAGDDGSFTVSVEKENFDFFRKGEEGRAKLPCVVTGYVDHISFVRNLALVDAGISMFRERGLEVPFDVSKIASMDAACAAARMLDHHITDNYGLDVARDFVRERERRADILMKEYRPVTRIELSFVREFGDRGDEMRAYIRERVICRNAPDFGSRAVRALIDAAAAGHSVHYSSSSDPGPAWFRETTSGMMEEYFWATDFSPMTKHLEGHKSFWTREAELQEERRERFRAYLDEATSGALGKRHGDGPASPGFGMAM